MVTRDAKQHAIRMCIVSKQSFADARQHDGALLSQVAARLRGGVPMLARTSKKRAQSWFRPCFGMMVLPPGCSGSHRLTSSSMPAPEHVCTASASQPGINSVVHNEDQQVACLQNMAMSSSSL